MMGISYSWQQKYEQAIKYYEQALPIQRELNHKSSQLEILNLLLLEYDVKAINLVEKGLSAQAKVEYNRIIELAKETLTLARELKNKNVEASALTVLGKAYLFFKYYEKATQLLDQAVSISRAINDLQTESNALSTLASIYTFQGKSSEYIKISIRQLEIAREQENKWSQVVILVTLAADYNQIGEYQKAINTIQEALAI